MSVIGVVIFLFPLAAGAASLALALYRPARGFGWVLLALAGAAMMLALPSAYMAVMESGKTGADGWVQVTGAIGLAGLGLFAWSVRRKVVAARRPLPGRCAACGYDRRGLDREARCPECGGTGVTG